MIVVDLKMLSGFSPDPDSLGRVSCCGVTFIHRCPFFFVHAISMTCLHS